MSVSGRVTTEDMVTEPNERLQWARMRAGIYRIGPAKQQHGSGPINKREVETSPGIDRQGGRSQQQVHCKMDHRQMQQPCSLSCLLPVYEIYSYNLPRSQCFSFILCTVAGLLSFQVLEVSSPAAALLIHLHCHILIPYYQTSPKFYLQVHFFLFSGCLVIRRLPFDYLP